MATISFTEYAAASEGGSMLFDPSTPAIWTARQNGTTVELQQFDPVTGAQVNDYLIAVTDSSVTPGFLTLFQGSIWFTGFGLHVCQIDPGTGTLLNQYPVDTIVGDTQITASGITHDASFLYVTYDAFDSSSNQKCSAIQMDPASGGVNWTTIFSTSNSASGPAFDGIDLWVDDGFGATLTQLSVGGAILNVVPVSGVTRLGPLIAADGLLSVIAAINTAFYQVDVTTLALTGPFPVTGGRFPLGLAADPAHRIWINDLDFGTAGVDFDVFDPASVNLGTLVSNLTDTGGQLTYDTVSDRMWSAGTTAGGPVMIAMGFSPPGAVYGTFTGFWKKGLTGGGTK